jgi:glycosyltransferase involved in cell wall biosynthesis
MLAIKGRIRGSESNAQVESVVPSGVLFVIATIERRSGGPAHTLAEYLAALAEQGVETVVATTTCAKEEMAWLRDRSPRTQVHCFPVLGNGHGRFSPALLWWVARKCPQFRAVHVFGLLNPLCSSCTRIALWRNQRVVVCALGMISAYTFSSGKSWLKRLWWRVFDLGNLKRATIHVESGPEAHEAAERCPSLASRLRIIPPPYRVRGDSVMPPRREDTVLFLSRLDPKKNLEGLIMAWPAVLSQRPRARLLIAGSGPPEYVSSLLELILQKVAHSCSIELLGFVCGDSKTELLRTATIFVLPSFRENFGLAALEAAAEGLPCVLSEGVDVGEFLASAGLARQCTTGIDSLAAALVHTLTDGGMRAHCGRHGKDIVAAHFAPRSIATRLTSLYAALPIRSPCILARKRAVSRPAAFTNSVGVQRILSIPSISGSAVAPPIPR